jgi:hypothetical protein
MQEEIKPILSFNADFYFFLRSVYSMYIWLMVAANLFVEMLVRMNNIYKLRAGTKAITD